VTGQSRIPSGSSYFFRMLGYDAADRVMSITRLQDQQQIEPMLLPYQRAKTFSARRW
jgi:hypothetical protein